MSGGVSQPSSSRRRNYSSAAETTNNISIHKQKAAVHHHPTTTKYLSTRKNRVQPSESRDYYRGKGAMGDITRPVNKSNLRVDTSNADYEQRQQTTQVTAGTSLPVTPPNVRGSRDLRSPGEQMTPVNRTAQLSQGQNALPDFITQTDANGNATTPRSSDAINGARRTHPTGPKPRLHVDKSGILSEDDEDSDDGKIDDPCEVLFENLRMMCCCLADDHHMKLQGVATEDSEQPIKLLGEHHPDDAGKPCLVLDLDETLVHSSFRAVPNADFVIPVQIEDVVHFVYVAKRPGVDEFLIEMAKHYEIVIYTASLNKYADPLLDILDPQKVIRARLFRESCVYYEGNYVKDLSLLNRDLSKTIIIDNSPPSYMFHPENAIDCSSFIDDRKDRELDQIGAFLTGIKDVEDVRGISNQWRDWPAIQQR